MKEYKCLWLDEEGCHHDLGNVNTNDPKRFLALQTAHMITISGNVFRKTRKDNIPSCIQTGKTEREHYFIGVDGDNGEQILSIIEINSKNKYRHAS